MSMTKVLFGFAALPLLAGVAFADTSKQSDGAKPTQLSEKQMDKVTAGWGMNEIDRSNTSWTQVLVWQSPNTLPTVTGGACPNCYLNLESQALSIYSVMGKTPR